MEPTSRQNWPALSCLDQDMVLKKLIFIIGVRLPKSQAPLTNCFIGHNDPALCQKFLTIAKTEREAEIQPNRVADDFRWEAKAFVARSSGVCFHEAIL